MKLRRSEYEVFKADFKALDINNNGVLLLYPVLSFAAEAGCCPGRLDEKEIVALLAQQIGRPPTKKDVATLMRMIDIDVDGKVSFDEYMTAIVGPGAMGSMPWDMPTSICVAPYLVPGATGLEPLCCSGT